MTITPSKASRPQRRALDASTPVGAAVIMLTWLAVLWLIEFIDVLAGGRLDGLGIRPRDPADLWAILTAPFIHYGWEHLIGNTLPFFVLGFVVLLDGGHRFLVATVTAIVTSGLSAWLFSPPGSITAGASGLIFGWLTYLLARGLFSRNVGWLIVGAIVLILYGGALWGVLPQGSGISWQSHLGGAVGGVLAAWWVATRRPKNVLDTRF